MINPHQPRDIPQILLSVLFLALIIISCLWVVQPFILSFAWAGTVVIATWPVLLRLQRVLFGKRLLAVLAMTLLLFLLFVIPIALLVNSLVDNSVPLIKLISSGNVTLPDFAWLNSVPLVGDKLYSAWHGLLDMGGSAIMAKVRPYIGTTTSWFVGQAAHIGKLLVYCGLMLLFSALLYWRGEQVAYGFRYFATRLAAKRGDAAVLRGAGRGGHCPHSGGTGRDWPCRLRRALRRSADRGDDLYLSGSARPFTGFGAVDYLALLERGHHLGHRAAGLELRSRHHGQRYSSGAHPHGRRPANDPYPHRRHWRPDRLRHDRPVYRSGAARRLLATV
ncbi:Putative membrane protein [Klebsiella pneumoniae subsp. pneumoniae ST512-K30BO]|nr:Putative membrane protein [Klebsiella pneumoniae subsp. pneumoniae ST512-K30BO]